VTSQLRFGVFSAPFYGMHQNPTLGIRDVINLVAALDEWGYDEAWLGEHRSGGMEIVGAPEILIAAAAERTSRIKLGTGVTTLSYHHPLIVADRMVFLDHLTRGRIMLGVGSGALPSDAWMMGLEVARQRQMMEESLEAIVALLKGEDPVSRKTDWFQLRDARLQLRPYQQPCFDIATTAVVSPSGPRLAGRLGIGMLSVAATSPAGFNGLNGAWQIVEEQAARFGTTPDRGSWRLVGPMHIAETEQQARENVKYGLRKWIEYSKVAAAFGIITQDVNDLNFDATVDALNEAGWAVIGTPEMAIAQIERLVEQTGGCGAFLHFDHNWANRQNTLYSYELFAREVIPHFRADNQARQASLDWMTANKDAFHMEMSGARQSAASQYNAEREAAAR